MIRSADVSGLMRSLRRQDGVRPVAETSSFDSAVRFHRRCVPRLEVSPIPRWHDCALLRAFRIVAAVVRRCRPSQALMRRRPKRERHGRQVAVARRRIRTAEVAPRVRVEFKCTVAIPVNYGRASFVDNFMVGQAFPIYYQPLRCLTLHCNPCFISAPLS